MLELKYINSILILDQVIFDNFILINYIKNNFSLLKNI